MVDDTIADVRLSLHLLLPAHEREQHSGCSVEADMFAKRGRFRESESSWDLVDIFCIANANIGDLAECLSCRACSVWSVGFDDRGGTLNRHASGLAFPVR